MSTTATNTTTVQRIPTGAYALDPVHSTFGFAIGHNGVSKFRGQFEQVQARFEDGVLMGTAAVESVKTPIPQLKDHLLSGEFFDAVNAPTIEFRSTDIRVADDGSAKIDGELTIRGVTRSVSASGSLATGENMSGAEVVGVDLQASIDRRDYGLDWQAQLPRGGDVLAWDVTLEAHLELVKA
jgi:polyisoprenoid-binding protein YceI